MKLFAYFIETDTDLSNARRSKCLPGQHDGYIRLVKHGNDLRLRKSMKTSEFYVVDPETNEPVKLADECKSCA